MDYDIIMCSNCEIMLVGSQTYQFTKLFVLYNSIHSTMLYCNLYPSHAHNNYKHIM